MTIAEKSQKTNEISALRKGPTPYYHQIGAIVRQKIGNGEFRVGERIPSEDELQQMFRVSRATVRQALVGLERDGLIERNPGRGSFVRERAPGVAVVKMTCLLEDLIALGIPARNVVRENGVVAASASVAEALGIGAGEDVFSLLRLVMVGEDPFAAHRFFLPARMAYLLSREDLANPHLLKTLEARGGEQAASAEQLIEAVLADAGQANLLDVDAGGALLSITRTSFNQRKNPIEHSVTLYRSDRSRFFISQRQRKNDASAWDLDTTGPRGAADARLPLSRIG